MLINIDDSPPQKNTEKRYDSHDMEKILGPVLVN